MIKKYSQFIKENKKEISDLEEISEYYTSDDDLREFFYELEDYGWNFSFERGIYREINFWNNLKHVYSRIVIPTNVNISHKIYINYGNINGNIIDILMSNLYRIADYLDSNIIFNDNSYNSIGSLNDDIIDILMSNKSELEFIFVDKKITKLKDIQVAKYYNWDYEYLDENGNIYIEYEYEELVERLCKESRYKDYLLDYGENMLDDYYGYGSEYQSDINSLFLYYINKENSNKIIKKIIDDNGGYEQIINDNEWSFSINNKEELINYLYKKPTNLKKLNNIELLEDIMQLEGDYQMFAHQIENFNNIKENFYDKLKNEISYEKINKNDKSIYRIRFDYKWYENYEESNLISFRNIRDIFYEYSYDIKFELNPYFKDYGDFNTIEFNKEIEYLLK